MATNFENMSTDLIWLCTRGNNSMLLKRKQAGGVTFSRDPLNLTNIHNRKYEGFIDTKAIGINPSARNPSALTLTTKNASAVNPSGAPSQPAKLHKTHHFPANTHNRQIYRQLIKETTKQGYRVDLRQEMIARASALRQAQRTKKPTPERKPRGRKALKLAAEGKRKA
ncbi:ribosomal protein L28e [Viridothelium virens]|uniref:Ribosomal protein L28e n=1 Tax=Viridothelium virens TaxID=1048519 RepID=A0A6A6H229_VIRVR|nr:ribosomal protein L28e [Viridothelium virens]